MGTEKAKTALMEEATVSVTDKFVKTKQLKKAALDAAIAHIKGTKSGSSDPVKAKSAAKITDDSEEKLQRQTLVAKINAICKSENFFFNVDANGQPKMTV